MSRKCLAAFVSIICVFVGFSLYANDSSSKIENSNSTAQLDIHLNFTPEINNQIKDFNNFLKEKGILSKFNITPVIDEHPVHLTLYLTGFNLKDLPALKSAVKKVAENQKPFNIETDFIEVSKGGYIMLNVKNSADNPLQILSNTIVKKTSKYRDKNYQMPAWVKYYPDKISVFKKNGSPTVFKQFTPHFNIIAVNIPNQKFDDEFMSTMNKAVAEYKFKPVSAKVTGIGIGYANSFGQITKEIINYKIGKE